MHKTRIALFGAVLLTLSACSSGGGSSDTATTEAPAAASSPSSEPSAEATPEASGDASSGAGVQIATTSLGDVLVDSKGMTLYMYDPDAQGASTCYDQCATAWPPLVVDGTPTVAAGADDSLVSTSARTDGKLQVTYNKWPVYYFAKDKAAGDTTGQGVGGVWWVLDAEGQPIGK